jgi:hypothetical protein
VLNCLIYSSISSTSYVPSVNFPANPKTTAFSVEKGVRVKSSLNAKSPKMSVTPVN